MRNRHMNKNRVIQLILFTLLGIHDKPSLASGEKKFDPQEALNQTIKDLDAAESVEQREKREQKAQQPAPIAPAPAPKPQADTRPLEVRADEAIKNLEGTRKPSRRERKTRIIANLKPTEPSPQQIAGQRKVLGAHRKPKE